jgi:apolipoprotein N-acyltransferase
VTGKEIVRTIVLTVVAGLGAASAYPPFGFAWVLPIAIALLLTAIDGRTPRQTTYTGVLFGMTFFGAGLWWLTLIFGQAAIALWAIAAIFPALFCGLFCWLRVRLPQIPVPILAAVIWTGIEFFRAEWMRPNFGFLSLGYALVNASAAMTLTSVLGAGGLTFLIMAFGAGLAQAIADRTVRTPLKICIAVWLAMFLLPHSVPSVQKPLHVRLVQANSEDDQALLAESHNPGKVDVIVWPEYSFLSDPSTEPKRWQAIQNLVRVKQSYLIFGGKRILDPKDERAFENTAWILDPQGQTVGTHVKNHGVHFVNDGKPGTDARAWQTERGKWGVAICFDMDFTDVARRLVQNGAEVFLVPADNPSEWGWTQHLQHRQMFQMRAAECGRWLATSDVAGNTFAVAPNGQIVAAYSDLIEPGFIDVTIGLETGQTLWTRGGWLFAPLCTFALPILIVMGILRRKTTGEKMSGIVPTTQ